MSNSRTRKINYKPRYTQMEAFDLLPALIRAALREGPQEWDTAALLREYRRRIKDGYHTPESAEREMARAVWAYHQQDIRAALPWQDKLKPGQRRNWKASPHIAAKATMLFDQSNRP